MCPCLDPLLAPDFPGMANVCNHCQGEELPLKKLRRAFKVRFSGGSGRSTHDTAAEQPDCVTLATSSVQKKEPDTEKRNTHGVLPDAGF